jgi:hypothetical protein
VSAANPNTEEYGSARMLGFAVLTPTCGDVDT